MVHTPQPPPMVHGIHLRRRVGKELAGGIGGAHLRQGGRQTRRPGRQRERCGRRLGQPTGRRRGPPLGPRAPGAPRATGGGVPAAPAPRRQLGGPASPRSRPPPWWAIGGGPYTERGAGVGSTPLWWEGFVWWEKLREERRVHATTGGRWCCEWFFFIYHSYIIVPQLLLGFVFLREQGCLQHGMGTQI
jgi:hypothetical protein